MKRLLFAGLLCAVLGAASLLASDPLAATLTVTNADDIGPGSMRDAINLASGGDEIVFDPSLASIPVLLTTSLQAATLMVTNVNDSGPGSLRNAIATASSGDEIHFDASLASIPIVVTSGPLVVDKNLRIVGLGSEETIVDGNKASNVFNIAKSISVTIKAITVRNGVDPDFSGYGSAGILSEGDLVLDHCVVRDNFGRYGAGIYSIGSLRIQSSRIENNSTYFSGGGIYSRGPLTITHSVIANNGVGAGGSGGGIHGDGTVFITDSAFVGNSAKSGGAISGGGPVHIANTTFIRNSGWGSAFYGSHLTMESCVLTENWNCAVIGDGIIRNSLISENVSRETIGGVMGSFLIVNSTISGNQGGGIGGASHVINSTVINNWNPRSSSRAGIDGPATVTNSIVMGNYYGDGTPSDCSDLMISGGHNIIGNTEGCTGVSTGVNGDVVGLDPATVFEPTLADNGGPTATFALLPGSPAIDTIPVAACTDDLGNPLPTDQRGVPRPQGAACDIGAFEFSAPSNTLFWLKQCREKKSAVYGEVDLDKLFSAVNDKSAAFPECALAACASLEPDSVQSSWKAKASRELLAVWLNLASGRLTKGRPVDLHGLSSATSVEAAVAEIEVAVCDPNVTKQQLQRARDMSDLLNEGAN